MKLVVDKTDNALFYLACLAGGEVQRRIGRVLGLARMPGKQVRRSLTLNLGSSHHAAIQGVTCRDQRHSSRGGGGGGLLAEAQAQTTLPPVIVVGTQPGGFGGGGGGGGGGGFGGGGSTDVNQEQNPVPAEGCAAFLLSKPASCPNPIPRPDGATFGIGTFRSGSAMARAIAYVNNSTRHPETQRRIAQALSNQTRDAGFFYNTLDTVNQRLFDDVRNACVSLKVSLDAIPLPFAFRPTSDERECSSIMDLIVEERGDPGFLPWFINWVNVQGIDPSDFIPQTLINALSPENTLTKKFTLTQETMKCALWWDWQDTYQCQP